MIKTSIKIDEFINEIYDCIIPDLNNNFKRSKLNVKKNENELTFEIEADDIVAFRATINSITQLLNVFYKTKNIK